MRGINNFTKDETQSICYESRSIAEVCEKIGRSKTNGNDHKIVKQYIEENNIDISHFTGQGWNKNNFDYSKFQNGKKVSNSRDALIYLRGRKCEICGNTEWMGQEIPLVVHHIDGNHLNNEINNLQILCPNCHAQTKNYCGKNMSRAKKYTDEQFVEALKNSPNIKQALISMGINYSAKGYYEKAYQLIKDFNIDMKEKCDKTFRERPLIVDGNEHTNEEWANILQTNIRTFNRYLIDYGEENVSELIRRFMKNPEKIQQKHNSVYFLYMQNDKNT